MRASEESTEQRLDRWQDLRDHLRDYGLHQKPPDDLLLEPEPATRPNVRLVAYYNKIKQESTGKKTVTEMLTTVLAVVLSVRVLTGFDRWFDDSEQPVTLGWLILTLVMLVFTIRSSWMDSQENKIAQGFTEPELGRTKPVAARRKPARAVA